VPARSGVGAETNLLNGRELGTEGGRETNATALEHARECCEQDYGCVASRGGESKVEDRNRRQRARDMPWTVASATVNIKGMNMTPGRNISVV
jgi:hypothetical protein